MYTCHYRYNVIRYNVKTVITRDVHSIVRRLRTNPPSKNQPAFFFSFCFLPPRLVFLQMNRKRMSLTGVLLQHSNWIRNCDLGVAGELQRRRTGWAGSGSGHRYRDRDRQRVWTWCTRHSGSRRRSDVMECTCRDWSGDYRKEKRSFRLLGRSSVEALGLRFWRLTPFDAQHRDAVNLGFLTRVTPWASVEDDLEFAEHDKYSFQAGQANVCQDWSHLLELNLETERHNDEIWKGLGNVTVFCVQRHCVPARTHAVLWAHDSVDLPVCNLEPGPSALETVAWWPKRIG